MKILAFIFFYMNCLWASSELPNNTSIRSDQVVPIVKNGEKSAQIPEDKVISTIKISDQNKLLKDALEKSRRIFRKNISLPQMSLPQGEEKQVENSIDEGPVDQVVDEVQSTQSATKKVAKGRKEKKNQKMCLVKKEEKQSYFDMNNGVRVFAKNLKISVPDFSQTETITLPSGSTALATLLAGIEVATDEDDVDARVDYAFLGPNQTVVELNGCRIWVRVRGNYNIERIKGEGFSLSCRTPGGKTFQLPVKMQLRDHNDEYVGVKAKLITRGKIAAAALDFLQAGVSGFGKAISAAQITQDVVGGGLDSQATKSSNITGNQTKYILGQTTASATGKFLSWWIDYYRNLAPTLAMPPGRKIFLTVKEEVQIPKIFFTAQTSKKSLEKYLKRLNTTETLTTLHSGAEDKEN